MKSQSILLVCVILGSVFPCLGNPVRVTPSEFTGARQPQIAATAKGEVFVTFGLSNSVYVAASKDGAKSFTAPKKIGEVTQLALGMRRGPRIVTGENTLTVTAISHQDGNLYAWTSDNGGESWSKPLAINTVATSAREGMHGLAGNGKGDILAVWLDLRNKKTELWGAKSSDGGKTWDANIKIYKSPDETICECCHPSVIFTPNGEIVAMWRNWLNGSRDMYRSVSLDGGKTFSAATKLGTGTWPLKGCPMDGGDLTAAFQQTAYVWRREQQLFFTTEPSSETLLAPKGTHPIVVPTEHGFAFGWQDQGNIYWKSEQESKPKLLAEQGAYASAVWSAAHRRVFAVWEGHDGIYSAPR